MKRTPDIAACGLGLLLAGTCSAQTLAPAAGKTNVILFVGNSFTHGHYEPVRDYNSAAVTDENDGLPKGDPRGVNRREGQGKYVGIPGIFKKLTDEVGLNYEVHAETVGGKNLEFHYRQALPVIAQARWDTVVLQDLSTGPLPESRNKATATGTEEGKDEKGKPGPAAKDTPALGASFHQYVTLLERAIHEKNPVAKVFLYETWPVASIVYPPDRMYSGEKIETMGVELHDAYYGAAAGDGHIAGVAPAGDAWLRAIHGGVAQENPYQAAGSGALDLWGADHKHPSSSGAYLAALVLFEEITGKDARTLGKDEQAAADLKISPENAARLQQVAFEQVTAKLPAAAVSPGGR